MLLQGKHLCLHQCFITLSVFIFVNLIHERALLLTLRGFHLSINKSAFDFSVQGTGQHERFIIVCFILVPEPLL